MTVYVCPKLDAACPDWHGHWCPECPKHTETKEVAELRAQLAEREREVERLREAFLSLFDGACKGRQFTKEESARYGKVLDDLFARPGE